MIHSGRYFEPSKIVRSRNRDLVVFVFIKRVFLFVCFFFVLFFPFSVGLFLSFFFSSPYHLELRVSESQIAQKIPNIICQWD